MVFIPPCNRTVLTLVIELMRTGVFLYFLLLFSLFSHPLNPFLLVEICYFFVHE